MPGSSGGYAEYRWYLLLITPLWLSSPSITAAVVGRIAVAALNIASASPASACRCLGSQARAFANQSYNSTKSPATSMPASHSGKPLGDLGLVPSRMRCMATAVRNTRSEEHTSELQSLMRTSYAVSCLKKKKLHNK